ncbi:unnamed protein product [Caenorhabditis brenneri]
MELPLEISFLCETLSTKSEKILSWGYCNAFIEYDKDGKPIHPERSCSLVIFLKNNSERYYRLLVADKLTQQMPVITFESKLFTKFRSRGILIDNDEPELLLMNINFKMIGLKFNDSDGCLKFYENVPRRLGNAIRRKETSMDPRPRSLSNHFQHEETDEIVNFKNLEAYQNRNAISLTADQEEIYAKLSSRLKMKDSNEAALVKQIVIKNEDTLRRSFRVKNKTKVGPISNDAMLDAKSQGSYENIVKDLPNDTSSRTKNGSANPIKEIQTEPKTKIVINAPFSIRQSYYLNIFNSSNIQISYTVNSSNPNVLTVYPSIGVLDKNQTTTLTLDFNPKIYRNMGSEVDYLIIDCTDATVGNMEGSSEDFERPFLIKTLRIEYNL